MAVALATLPLNRVLAGDGDTFFTTGAGAALAAGLEGAALAGPAGALATVFTGAGLATGAFATAVFVTGLMVFGIWGVFTGDVAGVLLPTTFFGACLAAACFDTGCLTGAFFGAAFFGATFCTAILFTTTFFDTALATPPAFFGCDVETPLPAGLADFFAVAGLGTVFLTGAALAAALVVPFVAVALAGAAFDLPALAGAFFCALVVELRVVFAISLHR